MPARQQQLRQQHSRAAAAPLPRTKRTRNRRHQACTARRAAPTMPRRWRGACWWWTTARTASARGEARTAQHSTDVHAPAEQQRLSGRCARSALTALVPPAPCWIHTRTQHTRAAGPATRHRLSSSAPPSASRGHARAPPRALSWATGALACPPGTLASTPTGAQHQAAAPSSSSSSSEQQALPHHEGDAPAHPCNTHRSHEACRPCAPLPLVLAALQVLL